MAPTGFPVYASLQEVPLTRNWGPFLLINPCSDPDPGDVYQLLRELLDPPYILRRLPIIPAAMCLVYPSLMAATYLSQVVVDRQAGEDVAVITHHWRWDGVGDPDESDFETIEDRIRAFWTAIQDLIAGTYTARDIRWYLADPDPGPPNPAILVSDINITGSGGSSPLPPQVACTVSERNDVRRRWGRFYIPGLCEASNEGTGRVAAATRAQIAGAAANLCDQTNANWKAVTFGAPSPRSLQIRAVVVDDIWDVQRRRRYEQVGGRDIIDV